jgi:hypothetical protein
MSDSAAWNDVILTGFVTHRHLSCSSSLFAEVRFRLNRAVPHWMVVAFMFWNNGPLVPLPPNGHRADRQGVVVIWYRS